MCELVKLRLVSLEIHLIIRFFLITPKKAKKLLCTTVRPFSIGLLLSRRYSVFASRKAEFIFRTRGSFHFLIINLQLSTVFL